MRRHRFHPERAQARALASPLSVALVISCAIGCGPIEYLDISTKAGAALAAAKRVDGERLAPYEFTAADEYLRKAREEAGYSQYQVSIEFGRRAEALAMRARALAEAKARTDGSPAAASATTAPGSAGAAAATSPSPAVEPTPASGRPAAPAVDSETPRR